MVYIKPKSHLEMSLAPLSPGLLNLNRTYSLLKYGNLCRHFPLYQLLDTKYRKGVWKVFGGFLDSFWKVFGEFLTSTTFFKSSNQEGQVSENILDTKLFWTKFYLLYLNLV